MLSAAPARTELAWATGRGGGPGWAIPTDDIIDTLAPRTLWAAADLIASPTSDRLRGCANAECGWLFVDRSRAGKRRWCSMAECGNRSKVRRHYRRKAANGSSLSNA